jgi:UDP-glucose 4-epimerase
LPLQITITGASGFVGQALIAKLTKYEVTAIVRNHAPNLNVKKCFRTEISEFSDHSEALKNCDVVIHCAARVHVMNEQTADPLEVYRQINTRALLSFAQQAAAQGVKRFIFISSIKVNGECTEQSKPFTAFDTPAPVDPYAQSKAEAELGLQQIALSTGMELVIIRPPLVYGPGVKANFSRMMALVKKGLPLPFGNIQNKRSMVALDNLVDLISLCVEHPKAANQIFLVSDEQDLSTPDLMRLMAAALGVKLWLINFPLFLLKLINFSKKGALVYQRLCGSLQVDITHTKETLDWRPKVTVEQQIKKIAERYHEVKIIEKGLS